MKKLLSIVMVLAMLLAVLPVSALADVAAKTMDPAETAQVTARKQYRPAEEYDEVLPSKYGCEPRAEGETPPLREVYSGTCGPNLTWSFDTETGVLTITGSGDMNDYWDNYWNRVPWYDYSDSICSVVLPFGLTSIGIYAFSECSSLTSVTIPNSVRSIGGDAFEHCTSLTSVTIPNSVTSIGDDAFWCCTSLASITIPDSVTSIGWGAFDGCTSLASITIGNSVTTIGCYAFCGCTSFTSITIPNSVTDIGWSVFEVCTSLTSVTIGNSVTRIGNSAFSGCTSLTSITIPGSVTSIEDEAFYGCTSLTTAYFLGNPPSSFVSNVFDDTSSGFTIYYPAYKASSWAPNGETMWNGYPIAPFDPQVIPGDADGNGIIDTVDALLILRCALGIFGNSNEMLPSCDVDGNGCITTDDALIVFRKVGKIDTGEFIDTEGLDPIQSPYPDNTVFFSVDSAEVENNEEFVVNINIDGDFAVHGMELYLNYDASALEVISANKGSILNWNDDTSPITLIDKDTPGQIKLLCIFLLDAFSETGTLASITFRAIDAGHPLDLVVADLYSYPVGGIKTLVPFTVDNSYTPFTPGYSSSTLPETGLRTVTVFEAKTLDPIGEAIVELTAHDGTVYRKLTSNDGTAAFSGLSDNKYDVQVAKEGYIWASVADVPLYSGNTFRVTLFPEDTPEKITGVYFRRHGSENLAGAPVYNLFSEEVKLPTNDETEYDVIVDCLYPDDQIEAYQLLCGGSVKKSSGSHIFTVKASDFTADTPIWVRVKRTNGAGYTEPKKLTLITYNVAYDLSAVHELSMMDNKISFTAPDDLPIIGGTKMSIDLDYIPAILSIKGDKIRIGLGLNDSFDPNDPNAESIWSELKSNTLNKTISNNIKPFLDNKKHVSFGSKVDTKFDVYGYVEGKVSNMDNISGALVIKVSFKVGWEWQTFFIGVPVVIKASLKAGIDSSTKVEVDFANRTIDFNEEIELVLPGVTASVGVGIAKVVDVSVYGSVDNILKIVTKEQYISARFDGEIGVSGKILLVEGKFPIWKGSKVYWERYEEPDYRTADSFDPYDVSNYSVSSRDYLTNQSKWLGKTATRDLLTARQTVTLQENVYKAARPQMIKAGATTLMVWLTDDGTRATGNHSMLVYSVQQADGAWSEPLPVWDDGTADFEPRLGTNGIDIYVTWMDTSAEFDENVTLDELSASCEISTAMFDTEHGFVQQRRVTSNSALDMQPCIAFEGNRAYVVWSRNDNNDVISQSGTNHIMYAPIGGSETELTAVTEPVNWLTAGDLGNGLNVFWCSDMDGDIDTADDIELLGCAISGAPYAITDNDAADIAPVFAVVNGNGRLFFLSGGELTSYDGSSVNDEAIAVEGNFSVVSDGADNAYLMQAIGLGDSAQLFISKRAEDGAWNEAIVLTDTEGYAENPAAVVNSDGGITAIYIRTDAEITEDDVITSSDICCITMLPSYNVTLNEVEFDEADAIPGETLPIELSITNNGELDIESFVLTVEAEGIEPSTYTFNESIASGETALIETEITLPENAVNGDFTFELSVSGQDFDESDNAVSKRVFYTDLGISVTKLVSEDSRVIIAAITNDSFIDTDATVVIRGSADGEVLAEIPLEGLEANTLTTLRIDDGYLDAIAEGCEMLYFTVEAAEAEYALGDNDDFVSVGEKALYTVTFLDWDGSLIYELTVEEGDAAIAPESPEREGFVFIGWDTDFSCVTCDLTVTALYEEISTSLPGDADGNGFVDTADALYVLRCALHIEGDPEDFMPHCDMDGNGIIDTTDALLILRRALGIS